MRNSEASNNSASGRLLIILSCFILVFASFTTFYDVYKYAAVGAVYELLWLPFLLSIPATVILASIRLFKEKFSLRSNAFLAIIVICISILIMVLFSHR